MSEQPQKSTRSDKYLHPPRRDSKPESLSHSHRSRSPMATDGNVTDLFGAGGGFEKFVEFIDREPQKRGRDEGEGSPTRGSPHRKQAKRECEEDGPQKDTEMTDVPAGNARNKDEDSDRDKMDMD